MTPSWLGTLVTFQVTFAELFIAASVLLAAAHRFGWRSTLAGSAVGFAAVACLAGALKAAAYGIALHWLDWISAFLLLGFGVYLTYAFLEGLATRGTSSCPEAAGHDWDLGLNAGGIGVAAWALLAEGLEILVVWLGVALKEGAGAATLGVGMGAGILTGLAAALRGTSIVHQVPRWLLDGVASVLVTGYGSYFLAEALMHR